MRASARSSKSDQAGGGRRGRFDRSSRPALRAATPCADAPPRSPSTTEGRPAIDGDATWPSPPGCRACRRPGRAGDRGRNAGPRPRASRVRDGRGPDPARSRSATRAASSSIGDSKRGVSSTSITRRRRLRMRSMHGVRDQAVEPVVERRRVTQPRQAAPRPDERLLDGVLGEIRVAQDRCGPWHPGARRTRERARRRRTGRLASPVPRVRAAPRRPLGYRRGHGGRVRKPTASASARKVSTRRAVHRAQRRHEG